MLRFPSVPLELFSKTSRKLKLQHFLYFDSYLSLKPQETKLTIYFRGVPAVVDLAAMRDAMKRLGGDPKKINPLCPVDLVIDHSVQVDAAGTFDAA